jgi:hypothetical protein
METQYIAGFLILLCLGCGSYSSNGGYGGGSGGVTVTIPNSILPR